jgi:hypothetical protein
MNRFFCCCLTELSLPPETDELHTYSLETTKFKVEVVTRYSTADLEVMEQTPGLSCNKAMFGCPVCMRYLSAMLETRCCGKHLCHLCANDLMLPKPFLVRCPHCNSSSLYLADVTKGAFRRS